MNTWEVRSTSNNEGDGDEIDWTSITRHLRWHQHGGLFRRPVHIDDPVGLSRKQLKTVFASLLPKTASESY